MEKDFNTKYLDKHQELCDRIHDTCVKKNHDYGNSASKSYHEFGLVSYIIRMEDKFNRIKSLSKTKAQVNDESIKDTLLDLANYCLLAVADIEMDEDTNG